MKILVINAGSSSLKYQLFDMDGEIVLAKGLCERIGMENSRLKGWMRDREEITIDAAMKEHSDAIDLVLSVMVDEKYGVISSMDEIKAIGHRVVHGGENFSASVVVNNEIKNAIRNCYDLAPLHNPPNLIGINACEHAMPGVVQVAVFDTAFHQTAPLQSYMYAIPYEMYEKYKIRKYGFHGISHQYVSTRAAEILQLPIEKLKIITCHLGNGSSVTAIKDGKSFDTSMGFTPLSGVVMGTRSGSIDPSIPMFLMEKENITINEVDDILNKKSGVLGVSGVSSDFRDLEAAANQGNERAKLALDLFAHSVKTYIGSYAAVMGGVDVVVFTAGIGENTPSLRAKILNNLNFLGIELDEKLNGEAIGKEMKISSQRSKAKILVIPTNEELVIARDTQKFLK